MTDTYTIVVYCDDESTRSGMHHGRTVKVMNFEWGDDPEIDYNDQFDHWFHDRVTSTAHARLHRDVRARREIEREGESPARSGDGSIKKGLARFVELTEEMGAGRHLPEPPVVMQTVFPDGSAKDSDFNESGTGYLKYVMECRLCGLNVQRRHADVTPALEQLRLAGISRISLVSFGRAIVASSNTE